MSDYIQVPVDQAGKKVDARSVDVGVDTVYRQRIILGDNVSSSTYATVLSAGPAGTEGGLVVRNIPSGTQTVGGMVSLTGTCVAQLVAGTANIGTINDISRTVQVQIQTPFTVNNISASVNCSVTSFIEKGTGSLVQVADSLNAALRVNIVAGAAAGVIQTDLTTFTGGVSTFAPLGGYMDDASTTLLTEDKGGAVRLTAARAMHASLRQEGGVNMDDTANAALRVSIVADLNTTATVQGNVSLVAGTANIGFIDHISATVNVSFAGGMSLVAGTANIGFINNISATVSVQGNVSLAAGVNKIGFIGKISAGVVLAAGAANIGIINNISAAVALAAGSANIGTINGVSATVTCVISGYTPAIIASTHGPVCATVSVSSAAVTIISSPGAGHSIYITQIVCANMSTTLTLARIGTSAANSVNVPLAASGGGFTWNFDPPWMLSASERCLCSVKPNASQAYFNINFFVV